MTRGIGAISDVHGSAAALAAALQWLDDRGVSETVCEAWVCRQLSEESPRARWFSLAIFTFRS